MMNKKYNFTSHLVFNHTNFSSFCNFFLYELKNNVSKINMNFIYINQINLIL